MLNFQGQLNSSQVIFGRVIWTPRPSLTPKSGFSAKSISYQSFGAGELSDTFLEMGGQGKKCWEEFFYFGPRARENRAIKGTPSKIRGWSLLVECNFLICPMQVCGWVQGAEPLKMESSPHVKYLLIFYGGNGSFPECNFIRNKN